MAAYDFLDGLEQRGVGPEQGAVDRATAREAERERGGGGGSRLQSSDGEEVKGEIISAYSRPPASHLQHKHECRS